ncbi:collagen alpha-1(I) chain-like [Moschus berezovskii]|uniref:collagen alpha-1(I) chain-like n=1 Tax=Moschus berezovskii TaxID=68408 RepID=UPI00244536CE|nr:collagen alpha-1(I) chain-like [Moschus berezovskii]
MLELGLGAGTPLRDSDGREVHNKVQWSWDNDASGDPPPWRMQALRIPRGLMPTSDTSEAASNTGRGSLGEGRGHRLTQHHGNGEPGIFPEILTNNSGTRGSALDMPTPQSGARHEGPVPRGAEARSGQEPPNSPGKGPQNSTADSSHPRPCPGLGQGPRDTSNSVKTGGPGCQATQAAGEEGVAFPAAALGWVTSKGEQHWQSTEEPPNPEGCTKGQAQAQEACLPPGSSTSLAGPPTQTTALLPADPPGHKLSPKQIDANERLQGSPRHLLGRSPTAAVLTSVFLGFPELHAAVLQLGEDLRNASVCPCPRVPATTTTTPSPPARRRGPRRGGQLPSLLRLVKDPNRPAQAAGRAGGRKLFPDSAGGPGPPIRWGGCLNSRRGGTRETRRHRETETGKDSHRGAGGARRANREAGTNPGKREAGRRGETERGRPRGRGDGNRKTETARWADRRPETERRQQRPAEKRLARGEAPGTEPGGRAGPGGRAPGAAPAPARPDPALHPPPGFLSAAHPLARPRISDQAMVNPGESGGPARGGRGAPWPPRAAPAFPRPRRLRAAWGSGGSAAAPPHGARGRAALRPRPKPLEAGRPRAGPGGTYRARRRGARRARRFLRGCLRAAAGGRGAPGGLGEAAGRAGGGPARLGWAALAPSAAPGGRAVRGSGEPSGSDVRGVSAPNRERGRAPRREGREKERAGGRRGRAPPGAQEGAPRPPAPRPRLPAPPWSPGPGPDAVRRRGGATGGAPEAGPRARRPPIVPLKHPPPDFSALALLSASLSPSPGLPGRAGPPGDKDGGALLFLGSRRCCFAPRAWRPSPASRAPNPTRSRLRDRGRSELFRFLWHTTSAGPRLSSGHLAYACREGSESPEKDHSECQKWTHFSGSWDEHSAQRRRPVSAPGGGGGLDVYTSTQGGGPQWERQNLSRQSLQACGDAPGWQPRASCPNRPGWHRARARSQSLLALGQPLGAEGSKALRSPGERGRASQGPPSQAGPLTQKVGTGAQESHSPSISCKIKTKGVRMSKCTQRTCRVSLGESAADPRAESDRLAGGSPLELALACSSSSLGVREDSGPHRSLSWGPRTPGEHPPPPTDSPRAGLSRKGLVPGILRPAAVVSAETRAGVLGSVSARFGSGETKGTNPQRGSSSSPSVLRLPVPPEDGTNPKRSLPASRANQDLSPVPGPKSSAEARPDSRLPDLRTADAARPGPMVRTTQTLKNQLPEQARFLWTFVVFLGQRTTLSKLRFMRWKQF